MFKLTVESCWYCYSLLTLVICWINSQCTSRVTWPEHNFSKLGSTKDMMCDLLSVVRTYGTTYLCFFSFCAALCVQQYQKYVVYRRRQRTFWICCLEAQTNKEYGSWRAIMALLIFRALFIEQSVGMSEMRTKCRNFRQVLLIWTMRKRICELEPNGA